MATLKSLVDETSNIKNEVKVCHTTLKDTLVEKNIECSEDDKLLTLIEKVKDTHYIKGYNKLPQWYKGQVEFSNLWITCKDITTARYYLTSSTVDGKIYCIGGRNLAGSNLSTNQCYDTETNTWSNMKAIGTARHGLTSSVVDNMIYAIGGNTGAVGSGNMVSLNQCYDPITDLWTSMASMTITKAYFTSSTVDGKIYCVGNTTNQCYDTTTNTWTSIKAMTTDRYYLTSSVVDGKIYAIGGEVNGTASNVNQCYDATTNTWTSKRAMPYAMSQLTSSTVEDKIYCIGGKNGNDYLAYNYCYNPSTNTWTTLEYMPTARFGLTSSSVDGKIYVISGGDSGVPAVNECYIP